MSGFKTLLWNALVVVLVAILPYLNDIDWTQYVSPTWAVVIVTAVNIGLRLVTTTPVFRKR